METTVKLSNDRTQWRKFWSRKLPPNISWQDRVKALGVGALELEWLVFLELVLVNPRLVPWQDKVSALEVGASQKVQVGAWQQIGALYILYLIYCKGYINKSIYSCCSFCVLNINDLTGKNNNWKGTLIHPLPSSLSVFPTFSLLPLNPKVMMWTPWLHNPPRIVRTITQFICSLNWVQHPQLNLPQMSSCISAIS